MTGRTYRSGGVVRLVATMALAFPAALSAQDGQFDLRTRGGQQPAPEPTTVGPSDPENPTPRARRAPEPPPPLVLPSTAPPSAAASEAPTTADAAPGASPSLDLRQGVANREVARPIDRTAAAAAAPAGGPLAEPATSPQPGPVASASGAPRPYQERDLGLIRSSTPLALWLALAGLAGLIAAAAWLAWSRYYRVRPRALPAPEIERPQVPVATQPLPAANDQPPPAPARAEGLELVLEATRMSATLIATTLSYRLAVTNLGAIPLKDVRIDGDMIAAHASRPRENVIGNNAAVLPPLHRIATLAPGESVTLGGDIRLPLVAITPIRSGNAAFFVPLARLRGRGTAPTGVTVEGGGTFLVGQEPGGNRKLQPFRLDLGPRNYSQLGQQMLPAA